MHRRKKGFEFIQPSLPVVAIRNSRLSTGFRMSSTPLPARLEDYRHWLNAGGNSVSEASRVASLPSDRLPRDFA